MNVVKDVIIAEKWGILPVNAEIKIEGIEVDLAHDHTNGIASIAEIGVIAMMNVHKGTTGNKGGIDQGLGMNVNTKSIKNTKVDTGLLQAQDSDHCILSVNFFYLLTTFFTGNSLQLPML